MAECFLQSVSGGTRYASKWNWKPHFDPKGAMMRTETLHACVALLVVAMVALVAIAAHFVYLGVMPH